MAELLEVALLYFEALDRVLVDLLSGELGERAFLRLAISGAY